MAVIIRLQNLPLSAKATNIRSFFQGLKIPDGGVNIIGGENGDAFIGFATDDDARKAMLLNNQPINGVNVSLYLSSKQEMLTILTEAKNKILKRSNPELPNKSPPQQQKQQNENHNYTLFNPKSQSLNQSQEGDLKTKVRIIDYSNTNDSDPPRPSEFSYKNSKVILINNGIDNRSENLIDQFKTYHHNENDPVFERVLNKESCTSIINGHQDNFDHFLVEKRRENGDSIFERNKYDQERNSVEKIISPINLNGKISTHPQIPVNHYHDYSERPAWLEEAKQVHNHSGSLIRVTLPFTSICDQIITDMFQHIVCPSKLCWKIELDMELRETGYVYVLFPCAAESTLALSLNGRTFRGQPVTLDCVCADTDFTLISDNPEKCIRQIDFPFGMRSPYYRDMCVEIINISSEINEKDVIDFLNVDLDRKRIQIIDQDGFQCCLIQAPDAYTMAKILSFDRSVFRFNSIRVVAISKFQWHTFLNRSALEINSRKVINTNKVYPNATIRERSVLFTGARKHLTESNTPVMSCAIFENLRLGTTAIELLQLFPSTIIPATHIVVSGSEAIIDFVSSATCQRALGQLKMHSASNFNVKPISNFDFQSIKQAMLKSPIPLVNRPIKNEINNRLSLSTRAAFKFHKDEERTSVKIKNLSPSVNGTQLKDILHEFQYQPISVRVCYASLTGGRQRHLGEAVLVFSNAMEAVAFKDEFHDKLFLQRQLEVLLSDDDYDRN